jgi:hypothetical protein
MGCLFHHEKELSATCKPVVDEHHKEFEGIMDKFWTDCGDDARRLCRHHRPGPPRPTSSKLSMIARGSLRAADPTPAKKGGHCPFAFRMASRCLAHQEKEVKSASCRADLDKGRAFHDHMRAAFEEMKKDHDLIVKSCADDFKKLCAKSKDPRECMAAAYKDGKLSADCKGAIDTVKKDFDTVTNAVTPRHGGKNHGKLQMIVQTMIKFKSRCSNDVAKLCSSDKNVTKKHHKRHHFHRTLKCLRRNASQVSPACKGISQWIGDRMRRRRQRVHEVCAADADRLCGSRSGKALRHRFKCLHRNMDKVEDPACVKAMKFNRVIKKARKTLKHAKKSLQACAGDVAEFCGKKKGGQPDDWCLKNAMEKVSPACMAAVKKSYDAAGSMTWVLASLVKAKRGSNDDVATVMELAFRADDKAETADDDRDGRGPRGGAPYFMIIGAVAAGLALVAIVAFVVVRVKNRRSALAATYEQVAAPSPLPQESV